MIRLLSIGIGRGHPFYLDGIAQALRENGAEAEFVYSDVFQDSDFVGLLGWKAMRTLYRHGGGSAGRVRLYGGVRTVGASPVGEWVTRALCRSLRRKIEPGDVCVVDHPILVVGLRGVSRLFYQHGELGVPPQCIVRGADRVFAPTDSAAGVFDDGGTPVGTVRVTGLCIEPDLLAGASQWATDRRNRYAGAEPLCVAVFSSGAEPPVHVEHIDLGLRALLAAGHRALVFARRGGALARRVRTIQGVDPILYDQRAELDERTAERFPQFDAVLSPAHERSNWGVGLGLPFLIVGPDVGPFPPRNREILEQAGVSRSIDSPSAARRLGSDLAAWRRDGELNAMSLRGEYRPVNGFQTAARDLLEAVAESECRPQ